MAAGGGPRVFPEGCLRDYLHQSMSVQRLRHNDYKHFGKGRKAHVLLLKGKGEGVMQLLTKNALPTEV
jgi:hypothetical protein